MKSDWKRITISKKDKRGFTYCDELNGAKVEFLS